MIPATVQDVCAAPDPPGAVADVDVWLVDLSTDPTGLAAVLDHAELAQADGLRTAGLQRRFVVRRAARREIVGGYLGLAPADVRFAPNPNGKPEPADGNGLHLSCSHREELAVIAVCTGAALSVDVEALSPGIAASELDAVAQVMLSPTELAAYRALPPAHRPDALLTAWTRKEAVVKALGVGLSLPLSSFDVRWTRPLRRGCSPAAGPAAMAGGGRWPTCRSGPDTPEP